jgi:uroporphyrinogen decarboxylase
MAMAYAKLREYLELPQKSVRVYDMVQQLAVVDEDVLDMFGVDTVEMGRGFLTEEKDWKEWTLPDGTPCRIPSYIPVEKRGADWVLFNRDGVELGIQKKGSLYFEQTFFPLRERGIEGDDFSDLEAQIGRTIWAGAPSPGGHIPFDKKGLEWLRQGAEKLRKSTPRAVIGLFGGNMFELPQWLYGMEDYLLFLRMFPDDVLRLSEALCRLHLANLDKWLDAVAPFIDVVLFGDDLGGQTGPLISPEMYRRFFKPYHKLLWSRARNAGRKVMLHCCGSVRDLLPDLIEAGLDAINPVQINSRGMAAPGLKEDFGDRITFWGGGCDTQKILPLGTPEMVSLHVGDQMKSFSGGGGFVFQQVHNIQALVPPENMTSMFRAAAEFRVKSS